MTVSLFSNTTIKPTVAALEASIPTSQTQSAPTAVQKQPAVAFFTSNTIGFEKNILNTGSTTNSYRMQTNLIEAKIKSFGDNKFAIKMMPMLNTDEKGIKTPQLRLTQCLPTVTFGKIDEVTFKGRLENRTTFKFNKDMQKTNVAQEPRLVLEATDGDYTARVIPRAEYSEQNPTLKFKDVQTTLQKKFGKFALYGDIYLKPETFKGDFSKISAAIGATLDF